MAALFLGGKVHFGEGFTGAVKEWRAGRANGAGHQTLEIVATARSEPPSGTACKNARVMPPWVSDRGSPSHPKPDKEKYWICGTDRFYKRYVWKKKVEEILAKIQRARAAMEKQAAKPLCPPI